MVSSLRHYDNDPDMKGRGPGLYYHRGKGEHSKYSARRDMNRQSKTKLKNVSVGNRKTLLRGGLPSNYAGKWAHTGDARGANYGKGNYW